MITLISPRLAVQKGDFLGSGVPYWPVELAILASFLKQKGKAVSVVDLFGNGVNHLEEKSDHFLQGFPLSKYFDDARLKEASCFIVYAISTMSHGEIQEITKALKSRFSKPVLILENSQAVTAFAIDQRAQSFFDAGADALICGEPYWNWSDIEAAIEGNFKSAVPENMMTKESTGAVKRLFEKNPSTPIPAWELFNLKGYWSLPYSHGPKTKRFFPILTSRGCPYPCDFCVVPQTNNMRWRGRSAQEVVEEMIALKDKFHVSDFQIEDLNPTVSKARTKEICDLLIEKKARVRFYMVSGTKAETIPLEQVPLLAKAGCRYISISPESGSKDVMSQIGKPFDYDHGLRLIKACRKNGIYTQACFVVGHPSETERDHILSKQYLKKLVKAGLAEAAFFILSPLPGSKLERTDKLNLADSQKLLSFSPKGRHDWHVLNARRNDLIRTFFISKFFSHPWAFFAHPLRALFHRPKTKMENLFWRIFYIKKLTSCYE